MIWLLDGNVLVALQIDSKVHREQAHRWFALSSDFSCRLSLSVDMMTIVTSHKEKHFMKGKIFAAGTIVLLMLTSAWAADVAGKWTAHIAGAQGQGDSDITLVLKVVDDKLTGTINNTQAPGEIEIKDGKITGDDVSFSLVRNIGGTETMVLWKGKIAGDEIKFTRTTQGTAAAGGVAPAAGAAPAGGRGGAGGGAATEIVAKRVK